MLYSCTHMAAVDVEGLTTISEPPCRWIHRTQRVIGDIRQHWSQAAVNTVHETVPRRQLAVHQLVAWTHRCHRGPTRLLTRLYTGQYPDWPAGPHLAYTTWSPSNISHHGDHHKLWWQGTQVYTSTSLQMNSCDPILPHYSHYKLSLSTLSFIHSFISGMHHYYKWRLNPVCHIMFWQ